MDIEKAFIKNLVSSFTGVGFKIKFWDDEEVLAGVGTPKFTIKLNEPLKKKDMILSTTLAFGEAYMDKKFEIDGDLYFALDSLLQNINHFDFDFT